MALPFRAEALQTWHLEEQRLQTPQTRRLVRLQARQLLWITTRRTSDYATGGGSSCNSHVSESTNLNSAARSLGTRESCKHHSCLHISQAEISDSKGCYWQIGEPIICLQPFAPGASRMGCSIAVIADRNPPAAPQLVSYRWHLCTQLRRQLGGACLYDTRRVYRLQ